MICVVRVRKGKRTNERVDEGTDHLQKDRDRLWPKLGFSFLITKAM